MWAVDTSGDLAALDLRTGDTLWHVALGVPVLAGLATSGNYLVAASYDGTLRALVPGMPPLPRTPPTCSETPPGGCRDPSGAPPLALTAVGLVVLRRRRRCARRCASDDSDLYAAG